MNAFDHPQLGGLRYNTSQYGSPIPVLWGTQRVSVNLLDFFNFQHSGSGKGGVTKGKSGGVTYSADVAMGLCVGPAFVNPNNSVWVNNGIQAANKTPINWWNGTDGQPIDPTFASQSPNQPAINYSGLSYATATPMQLGNSPVLPNLSAEVTGFAVGSAGNNTSVLYDASPASIVFDMLYDSRVGIGFPGPGADFSYWKNFCQAALLGFSLLCDKQQPLASWIEEILLLTSSAGFWSSGRFVILPYSIDQFDQNNAVYYPNLTPVAQLTDDDFMPWSTGGRQAGEKDPVLVTRSDVTQITNWLTLEIMLRQYWYEPYVQPPQFDQASMELYGVRTTSSVQAHEICTFDVGSAACTLMLRRKMNLRNTFKFRVGWRYMLLEPMDIVGLTDYALGLQQYPVRIIDVEEDDGGFLTMTAEELV